MVGLNVCYGLALLCILFASLLFCSSPPTYQALSRLRLRWVPPLIVLLVVYNEHLCAGIGCA